VPTGIQQATAADDYYHPRRIATHLRTRIL